MASSITIDRGVIEYILGNESILNEIPSLRMFLTRRRRVSACCGRGQRSDKMGVSHIRQAKISLMGLPANKMTRLKKLLKADTLVFHVPGKGGPGQIIR